MAKMGIQFCADMGSKNEKQTQYCGRIASFFSLLFFIKVYIFSFMKMCTIHVCQDLLNSEYDRFSIDVLIQSCSISIFFNSNCMAVLLNWSHFINDMQENKKQNECKLVHYCHKIWIKERKMWIEKILKGILKFGTEPRKSDILRI